MGVVTLSRTKKVLMAGLAGALLFTGGMFTGSNSVLAKKATETIRVHFANIKLIVNGKEIQTQAEPFTYNGNVYVPAATIANMFGIGQAWENHPPSVRFESGDRVTSAPQYMGTSGRSYYALDYIFALPIAESPEGGTKFENVFNLFNNQSIVIPKVESTGILSPISRMVHADMFYMLETNSKGAFINAYKIDKVKMAISKEFSRKIEPVKGHLTFNEATREFTEKLYGQEDGKRKLTGVKVYQINWENQITKTEELITQ